MKPAPRLAWLIPVGLLALIWTCALLASPRHAVTPVPTAATRIPAAPTPTPVVLAALTPAISPTSPAASGEPDWTRLAIQAHAASIQWQQRAETLARQTSMPLAIPASDPAKERDALAHARNDRERFELYDCQGKAWRERALTLEALLPRGDTSPPRAELPVPRASANGLPSDEEIAAQARANANTYAPAVTSNSSGASVASASPPVDEASKTQHVRSYIRKDGTQVESYNRRPPSH